MGNFGRDNRGGSGRGRGGFGGGSRFGGGRGFGGGGRSFGRDDRPREMHHATCGNCGKDCEVPFRPTGERPVYCSDCFEKMGNGEPRRSEGRGFDRGPSRENRSAGGGNTADYKRDFESLNAKLDRILNLLSPQTVSAPVKETPSEPQTVEETVPVVEKKTRKKKTSTEETA